MAQIERLRIVKDHNGEERRFEKGSDILTINFSFPNAVKIIPYAKTDSEKLVPLNARVGGSEVRELHPEHYQLEHQIHIIVTVEESFTLELHAFSLDDTNNEEVLQIAELDKKQAATRNVVQIIKNIVYQPAKGQNFFKRSFAKTKDVTVEIRIEGDYPLYADCAELVIDGQPESIPQITLNEPFTREFQNINEVYVRLTESWESKVPADQSVIYKFKN